LCAMRARHSALGPERAQSACRGTAGDGSPAAKPWQGVHNKLLQPMVHSPDTIESPSSQCGRRATEGQNSPVRSTALDGSGGWGKSTMPQKAAPRWVGAPVPVEEERGRLVRSGNGEPVIETGAEATTSLPADGEASGANKMHGEGLFYGCVGGGWMGWTRQLGLGS
jgi:hypothetical protein